MSMENYPTTAYLIDIEEPDVQDKLQVRKEWEEFTDKLNSINSEERIFGADSDILSFTDEIQGLDLEDWPTLQDFINPKFHKAVDLFVKFLDKFDELYHVRPELIYLNDETEGLDPHLEKNKAYLAIDSSLLFIRKPTDTMKKLSDIGATPQYSQWSEWG